MDRRAFLGGITAASLSVSLPHAAEAFGINDTRALRLYNVHNRELVHVAYWRNGRYLRKGVRDLNHFFRDWRNNKEVEMATDLFDILYGVQQGLRVDESGIHLLSGYRSPETNAMLRRRSKNVAKTSLHMKGRAGDIRIPDVNLKNLHKAAKALNAGGVGYYGRSNFVHVDNGRVRYW